MDVYTESTELRITHDLLDFLLGNEEDALILTFNGQAFATIGGDLAVGKCKSVDVFLVDGFISHDILVFQDRANSCGCTSAYELNKSNYIVESYIGKFGGEN